MLNRRHVTALVTTGIMVVLTFTGVASYAIVSNQNNDNAVNNQPPVQQAVSDNLPVSGGGSYFEVCIPGETQSMVFYWDSTPDSLLSQFPPGSSILASVPAAQQPGEPGPVPCKE